MNRLWRDNSFSYILSNPVCVGNESNVLDCQYSATSTPCGTSYYYNYETSVICIPSKT